MNIHDKQTLNQLTWCLKGYCGLKFSGTLRRIKAPIKRAWMSLVCSDFHRQERTNTEKGRSYTTSDQDHTSRFLEVFDNVLLIIFSSSYGFISPFWCGFFQHVLVYVEERSGVGSDGWSGVRLCAEESHHMGREAKLHPVHGYQHNHLQWLLLLQGDNCHTLLHFSQELSNQSYLEQKISQ